MNTAEPAVYSWTMGLRHLGLRVQIVLSLGALLAVVFSFTAMAMLWVLRVSIEQQRQELGEVAISAVAQGVAARLRHRQDEAAVGAVLSSTLGRAGVVAAALYDGRGELVASRSLDHQPFDLDGIDPRRPRPFHSLRRARQGRVDHLLVIHPLGRGRGAVALRATLGPSPAELGRLARPVLIYLLSSGLLLLVFGYVALTNLMVRPLEALTRATDQVTHGRLDVSVPVRGGRELASAAVAFNTMTKRLKEQTSRLEQQKEQLELQLGELEQTTAELQTTQVQLVRSAKLASVGSLAAGVAHEVGNPVSAILGLSEVLLEGDLEPEESQDYLGRIRHEAERVNRIIRDLLEYARSSPEAQCGLCSVAEAADAAVGLMAPQKTFRLIDVQVIIDDDLSPVCLSLDQLTQVLLNLLMNAADAVGGEGEVRLRARRAEEAVRIEVSDSGPGVPDDQLEQIFDPFYTTKDPGEGTGLGLATCEGIVARAGGTVSARNKPGGGLTVTLELPLAEG